MTSKADFRFLSEIGRGSFGKVDKVRRKKDGRICVCKHVPIELLKTEKQRLQALNEAKIMRELNCQYIVQYLDAFIQKNSLFLILEYCNGTDLKAFLKKARALPDRSIWRYFLRIGLGLQYLHSKRILHRDIKSDNIFLHGTDEGLRVGDLGLARMLSDTQSGASTLVGTPRYLSPEEVKGLAHYNDKCDVWSLGIILYELCSDGHQGPFDKAIKLPELMRAILNDNPPALPQRVKQFKEVSGMLLEKDAERRPSVSQVLAMDNVAQSAEKHLHVSEVVEEPGSAPRSLGPGAADVPPTGPTSTPPTAAPPPGLPDGCLARFCRILGPRKGPPESRWLNESGSPRISPRTAV